jgi:hypothetical protein
VTLHNDEVHAIAEREFRDALFKIFEGLCA